MSIRITIARTDGRVTRLEGESGLAVCMGPMDVEFRRSDPPVVSLRCASEVELAWNLAAVMAAVEHQAPAAFELAKELARLCDFRQPLVMNRLPPEPQG